MGLLGSRQSNVKDPSCPPPHRQKAEMADKSDVFCGPIYLRSGQTAHLKKTTPGCSGADREGAYENNFFMLGLGVESAMAYCEKR